jgi:hypothetical protein
MAYWLSGTLAKWQFSEMARWLKGVALFYSEL